MTFNRPSLILISLFLPLIGSTPIVIPNLDDNHTPQALSVSEDEVLLKRFATRAEDGQGGGGGGIGVGAIAGIIIAIVLISLLLTFIYIKQRRSSPVLPTSTIYTFQPPAYTSPPPKIIYQSQQTYPSLPKYTGPSVNANRSETYVRGNGLRFPSAIHPSSRGYYGQRTARNDGAALGVRFGEVGVRGY